MTVYECLFLRCFWFFIVHGVPSFFSPLVLFFLLIDTFEGLFPPRAVLWMFFNVFSPESFGSPFGEFWGLFLNEVLACPLNLIRFPSIFAFFCSAVIMAAILPNSGASPNKRKRNNKPVVGTPLILPGATTTAAAVVTPEEALKLLNALQSLPEHIAVQSVVASPPAGLTGVTTQGDLSDQDGALLGETPNIDADMISAVDVELEQAELLLKEAKLALEARSLALIALYIASFISSLIFGPILGRLADQYGRKRLSLICCATFSVSCILKMSLSFFFFCVDDQLSCGRDLQPSQFHAF